MISIYKKSILTQVGPFGIENLDPGIKNEIEETASSIKDFFGFSDYTNIYLDDKTVSIKWRNKSKTEDLLKVGTSLKNKIDSLIKKIYTE